MPRAVTVPGGTSVNPASTISAVTRPRASATDLSSYKSLSVGTLSATFRCPSLNQRLLIEELERSYAVTAACASCTAAFPGLSRRSERMMRHCLNSMESFIGSPCALYEPTAGPSASMTAKYAAQEGVNVLIIEEHATIGQPVQCSGIISTRAYEECEVPL